MDVMQRLFERDQRHRERLDVLIRLVAAFEGCEEQVGERICEIVGEEEEDVDRSEQRKGIESDMGSVSTVELDFGSIGEDLLEDSWFGCGD